MFFRQVLEPNLAQYTYIVGCQRTGEAIVIDPMRDIDRYIEIAREEGLKITHVTETHIHADYLSGAREFAERLGVNLLLSDEGDANWKYFWASTGEYNYHPLKDSETFKVGNIQFKALHTPGHTPEHLSFLVTDMGGGADEPMGLISGDFVFVGDLGRPDLLESAAGIVGAREPSARRLFHSVQSFLDLPEYLQIWPGHGAGSACGKALGAVPDSTVGYEKRFNSAILAAKEGEATFVKSILDGQPEPPVYFARMKRDNRDGPPVLGPMPQPAHLTDAQLVEAIAKKGSVLVDIREDRSAFMERHVSGALYAPLNKSFPTITGSYIQEDDVIYLMVESEEQVQEAVLNLIRIGLDTIRGYVLVDALDRLNRVTSIREIDTTNVSAAIAADPQGVVLDVRRLTEYAEGHVPGAVNIAHTRLRTRLGELDTNNRYYIHCRSGARAAAASAFLLQQGFDAVYVNGLYADWAKQQAEAVEATS